MKIVLTDNLTVSSDGMALDFLKKYGEVTAYGLTPDDEIAQRVKDADMIFCNKTPLNRETLRYAENLKYIGIFATGYNNVDLDYAREKGIVVCNVPSYSTDAVAQLVFAYILSFYSKVSEYNSLVHEGEWIKSPTFSMFPLPISELCGKTMGIIGYGSIGSQVAKIANAFGMRVLCFTRTPKEATDVIFADLETVLRESDVLSLHCPLTPQSQKLINEQTISQMKDGAILINTSRGAVIDENAVAQALSSGKLGGAAVDVLEIEPMSKACPLFKAKNCIITPHIAWTPVETRQRLLEAAEANLKAFLFGKPINNVAI